MMRSSKSLIASKYNFHERGHCVAKIDAFLNNSLTKDKILITQLIEYHQTFDEKLSVSNLTQSRRVLQETALFNLFVRHFPKNFHKNFYILLFDNEQSHKEL